MANEKELFARIKGHIYNLEHENYSLSQEIALIKETENLVKELMGMLEHDAKEHAKDLLKNLEKYRAKFLEEFQTLEQKKHALDSYQAKKLARKAYVLDMNRKALLADAWNKLGEISYAI